MGPPSSGAQPGRGACPPQAGELPCPPARVPVGQAPSLRFVADCMLGRLARWLRAFGFDVVYHPFAEDEQLVRWARQRGAILLTRDTHLAQGGSGAPIPPPPEKVPQVRVIFLQHDRVEGQLRQVVTEAPIDLSQAQPLTRCTACNEPLRTVEKEAVRDRIPPYVYATQEIFSLCPGCQRIYWQGTHASRIRERLARLVEQAG